MKKQRTIMIPDDLDDYIEQSSKRDLRSYTAQVVYMLRNAQKDRAETQRVRDGGSQIDLSEINEMTIEAGR